MKLEAFWREDFVGPPQPFGMSDAAADVEFFQGEVVALHAGALNVEVAVDTDRLAPEYGPRFDRSAQVVQVRWDDREFLAADGLPDEFGLWGHGVLGFDSEAPGEFVKVGVGRLRNNEPGPFKPFQHWPVAELARNVVTERATDRITVEQTLTGKVWSYRQIKTYTAKPDGRLTIDYTLTNLGSEPIPVEHYNHNFFAAPVDQEVSVQTAFPVPEPPMNGPWQFEFDWIVLHPAALNRPHPAWEWSPENGAVENRIDMAWSDGFGVLIEGDFPVRRFALWAKDEMICPEVFHRFELPPGASAQWVRRYRFYGPSRGSGF